METKEAIEFLRSMRPMACGKCLFVEVTGECNPECNNPKHRKYIDMAIDALRRQKKEPCEYCNEVIYRKAPFLTHDEYHMIENRYCPYCGRKSGEGLG